MKKVIKLLIVCLLIVSFTIPVFAAKDSAQLRVVTEDVKGSDVITKVLTDAPQDVNVIVIHIDDPEDNAIVQLNLAEARANAAAAGVDADLEHLDSFVIEVRKGDEKLSDGARVILELEIPEADVGGYLYVMRSEDMGGSENPEDYTTEQYQCIRITGTKMVIELERYGTFTLVVADKPLSPKSPRTGDRFLPAILCVTAIAAMGGALLAKKRRED